MASPARRTRERAGRPLAERLLQWLELGIPRDALTPDQRQKVLVVSISTSGMIGVALLAALQQWWVGKTDVLAYLGVATLGGLANLRLLRATRQPVLSGHIAVGILAGLISVAALTAGGFYNPSFAWLYIVPLAASVSTDMRGTVVWTAVTMAIMAGFWLLPGWGIQLVDTTPPELRAAYALTERQLTVLSLGTMALSFAVAQRRAAGEFLREAAYRQMVMHAAVVANEARSFDEALGDAVARICGSMGWQMGHVWQVGDDGTCRSADGPMILPDALAELGEMTERSEFARGEGLPGHVAATGRPELVTDLQVGEFRPRARLAVRLGVRSAVAVPVLVHGRVRAVLEFATTSRLSDLEPLRDVMVHIATQLGRVAERTAVEERVRQTQKMEAVGQLAAGLAHEINNPMAYVRSNLYSLRDAHAVRKRAGHLSRAEQAEWEDSQDLIDESLDGVERTIAIVRDVTRFSRTGGPDPAGWEPACLDALLRDALRVAGSRAGPGVRIDIDSRPSAPLRCAPNSLRQVFTNLILNALQAVGPGGWVGLSTHVEGEHVVVRVEDDGPGLSAGDRERLFDPFFTTKAVGEGTGLGLTVSYEIVRSHGGEIRVESEPGAGAVFEVVLPLSARRDQSAT